MWSTALRDAPDETLPNSSKPNLAVEAFWPLGSCALFDVAVVNRWAKWTGWFLFPHGKGFLTSLRFHLLAVRDPQWRNYPRNGVEAGNGEEEFPPRVIEGVTDKHQSALARSCASSWWGNLSFFLFFLFFFKWKAELRYARCKGPTVNETVF